MHMNNKKLSSLDMRTNTKTKVCSTPERRVDSPTIDTDSICDSETASPIPFLCTQDDADVVYNFYTPKSQSEKAQFKGTTPVSKKVRKPVRLQVEKRLPKRKIIKPSNQRNKWLQDLRELNQNVHELVNKSSKDSVEKPQSEEDIFSDTSDSSPRTGIGSKKRCLRKNVLSFKLTKAEPESGLDSDDSVNDYLIQVSQAVEEKFNGEPKVITEESYDTFGDISFNQTDNDFNTDSVHVLQRNNNLESSNIEKTKKRESTIYNNESFDSLLGNLNDSVFDNLTQIPINGVTKTKGPVLEMKNDTSLNKSFVRHNSMPVSPSVANNRPSTSGMSLGRFKSMPFNQSSENMLDGCSIKYTQDEIKKKHQQAREKLLAKGMLPLLSQKQTSQMLPAQKDQAKNNIHNKSDNKQTKVTDKNKNVMNNNSSSESNLKPDIKTLIEKKRQEALMKLRKRQAQCR
ncbi:unnamed protein product [Danaus chrysippus]|uniref:(African queen) hypothetical protein n=1 Tax=Danaus chrysippus TaxID=151541 RepID=A0A8J2VS63_9NEOP|nr:unnamed protein product [Danaus chrysippus]